MQDLSLKERNYIVNAVKNLLTCGIFMLVFLSNSPWAGSLLNVFTPERVPNSKAVRQRVVSRLPFGHQSG